MRRLAAVMIVALVLALFSCSDSGPNAGLDRPIQLAYQDPITLPGEDLTIVFVTLDEDSRCPIPPTCLAAGQATISLVFSKPDAPVEPHTLTLGPNGGTNVASYPPYTITLVKLAPHPVVGHPQLPSDYVATLVVSKSL